MSHSNSSLNCFAACMKKYEHSYILHTPPCKPVSPHLTFGTMAHEVLYKAGCLRDDAADNVVTNEDYYNIIPSELLYPELKEAFGISSWQRYFTNVIKACAKYENDLIEQMLYETNQCIDVKRELKVSITPNELLQYGYNMLQKDGISQHYMIDDTLVGIIDLLLISGDHATIIDYKFSSSRKSQDDFDLNSQLPLYAFFVHKKYGIPIRNIRIGYIDIPKKEVDKPTLLKNGTLSRAKSQNVTQEMYKKCVEAVHGEDPVYNCEPGGYYYETYCALALNKTAYLSVQYIDEDAYNGIIKDLFNAARMIDFMKLNNMPFLQKYDAYTCKNCEYVNSCKPWLNVGGNE